LDEGRIQQLASPQGLLQQPDNDFVKELLDFAGAAA